MENKPTLEHFKGSALEAKFSNCMTIELWYSNGSHHKYEDAKILMSEVVKCWNMHDELVSTLNEIIECQFDNESTLANLNGLIDSAKEVIEKATK